MHTDLPYYASILSLMFRLIETNAVKVPIDPQVQSAEQNVEFLHTYLSTMLKNAFPHLTE